jgi:hypothetical protein
MTSGSAPLVPEFERMGARTHSCSSLSDNVYFNSDETPYPDSISAHFIPHSPNIQRATSLAAHPTPSAGRRLERSTSNQTIPDNCSQSSRSSIAASIDNNWSSKKRKSKMVDSNKKDTLKKNLADVETEKGLLERKLLYFWEEVSLQDDHDFSERCEVLWGRATLKATNWTNGNQF